MSTLPAGFQQAVQKAHVALVSAEGSKATPLEFGDAVEVVPASATDVPADAEFAAVDVDIRKALLGRDGVLVIGDWTRTDDDEDADGDPSGAFGATVATGADGKVSLVTVFGDDLPIKKPG